VAISVEANNKCHTIIIKQCPIFASDFRKFGFYRNIFTLASAINFHRNLSGGRRVHVPAYRRTDVKQIGFNSCCADVHEVVTRQPQLYLQRGLGWRAAAWGTGSSRIYRLPL
jgi:hypothetical protein